VSPLKVSWSGRIPPQLLADAKAKAASEGKSLTGVVVAALQVYVKGGKK